MRISDWCSDVCSSDLQVYLQNPGMQPELQGKDYILERQLKPEARGDVLELLKALEIKPTSMIDISDGLASETLHLATRSGLGCKLFEEKIPIDPMTFDTAREFGLDPTVCALSGGEDRSEEHTSELQSLMRISYADFCLKKKKTDNN